MTFGAGGHTRALLDMIPGCHVIALDRDPQAYSMAKQLAVERYSNNVIIPHLLLASFWCFLLVILVMGFCVVLYY